MRISVKWYLPVICHFSSHYANKKKKCCSEPPYSGGYYNHAPVSHVPLWIYQGTDGGFVWITFMRPNSVTNSYTNYDTFINKKLIELKKKILQMA